MGRLEPVDAHRDAVNALGFHCAREIGRDSFAAGRHDDPNSTTHERVHDVEKTIVQVGFAADEDDLVCAHRDELVDHAEGFARRQLSIPRVACA